MAQPVHNGGNYRFCARLKVLPFSLNVHASEWEFWSKFYLLQILFFSEGIFFIFTTYLQLPMVGLKIKLSKNIFDWLA
jgi:hypothetical protein